LPKLLVAAEAYPRTSAGLSARYRAAATLVALGRDDEAAKRYQEVIDLAGADMYGRMARLGLAEVKVRQKQYEAAINTYKELSLRQSTGGRRADAAGAYVRARGAHAGSRPDVQANHGRIPHVALRRRRSQGARRSCARL
jgi:predicted negative regulator of RcsB-dependent stress response